MMCFHFPVRLAGHHNFFEVIHITNHSLLLDLINGLRNSPVFSDSQVTQ